MHFLKHNETLESCSMVALNRLLKVSESFHGGILAIQDSNGTGPISQVFQSQLCDFWENLDPTASQVQWDFHRGRQTPRFAKEPLCIHQTSGIRV